MVWDAVCFSETRATSADVALRDGHRLVSGLGAKRHEGVAILLHARWAGKVSRIHAISARVMAVDVDADANTKLCIVAGYAPHSG